MVRAVPHEEASTGALTGKQAIRVAADIGGTFTDVVAVDDAGRLTQRKVASSPDDFGRATVDGIVAAVPRGRASVAEVVHATTIATNAILEGRGARTALLTTRGFRDVLELRRVRSPVLYDHFWRPPTPLVPREWRLEVDERVLADGSVDTPLDEASVLAAVDRAIRAGVEAIAISFLHAYRNGSHEAAVAAIVRARAPKLFVSSSSEVLPELGEYERTSTTVINAYIGPIVSGYLGNLERRLRARQIVAPVYLMQSNGGVMALDAARERPAAIVESGPAAGVVGAARLAAAIGEPDLITLDMGGTTTKASLVEGGRPTQTTEYEVGVGISASGGVGRGRGHALKLPVLDIAEVGAGGGSIVRVTAEGGLRVGPESAGAVPGPAAYGAGGTAATVADATLVLGYLNPVAIAGGAVRLQPGLAEEAIARDVAGPLGLELAPAAHGVFRVAVANMARAVKAVTTYRGRSPSTFALLAFGGNGPMFAVELARELEIRRVIVPAAAGLFSSVGLLDAEEAQHLVRAFPARIDRVTNASFEEAFAELEAAISMLKRERTVDMRYRGQSGSLSIPVPAGPIGRTHLRGLAAAFAAEHERTYGYAQPGEPIELVNLRVVARAGVERPSVALAAAGMPAERSTGGKRRAYFGPDGWLETPLLSRADLAEPRNGPLIVEEYDATILVPPRARAWRDQHGLVVIQVGQ
jgi:N-methylhydantoinase A